MASLINRAAIPGLLQDGANSFFGDYSDYPQLWRKIFTFNKATKAVEFDYEMKYLSTPGKMAEGASMNFDGMQQMFQTTYTVQTYGLGFVITQNAIEDNLYAEYFPQGLRSLKTSFLQNKEQAAAGIFNQGFAVNVDNPMGDGKPLYSTAHPTYAGTYSNMLSVSAGLNQTSLQDALIQNGLFTNAAGLLINTEPKLIHVPLQLRWVIDILMGSKFEPGSANNAKNPMFDVFPEGAVVNPFLTNPSAWFIMNKNDNGCKYFEKTPLVTNVTTDPHTFNVMTGARERFVFGVSDPRCTFGVQGI